MPREQKDSAQLYVGRHVSVTPDAFDLLDEFSKGMRISKSKAIAAAIRAVMSQGETPLEAGERLAKEESNQ